VTILSQADFARRLGVKPSYVTELKKAGRLVLTDDGKVDAEASEANIAATADPGKAGVAARHSQNRNTAVDAQNAGKTTPPTAEEQAEKATMTYQQARAVKERYNALQAKADYEAYTGKLVEYDKARAAGADLGVLFRSTIERWPDTITPLLVGQDEAGMRATLADQVESLLGEIVARISALLPENKT